MRCAEGSLSVELLIVVFVMPEIQSVHSAAENYGALKGTATV